jgi:hypothetical protein
MAEINNDPLLKAVDATKPIESLMAPLPYSHADIQRMDADKAAKALAEQQAANDKLAQEALLSDPAKMRQIFPQVYKDVSLNHNDHLDLIEIQKGLHNPNLSSDERNLLTVMEQGYKNFTYDPTSLTALTHEFDYDANGVSAGSLTMLDKAIDRKIPEDPYYDHAKKVIAIAGPILNGAIGAGISAAYGDSWKEMLAWGGALAVGGTLEKEYDLYKDKTNGTEDKMYDQIKTNYQSFVADFKKGQTQAR